MTSADIANHFGSFGRTRPCRPAAGSNFSRQPVFATLNHVAREEFLGLLRWKVARMELRVYPDKVLCRAASALREVTDDELARAREMLGFMYELEGVGLAGPQIGWRSRVVTLDVENSKKGDRIFVNPRIVSMEGEQTEEEGCLSLPGVRARVTRANRLVVVTYTIRGKRVELEVEGLPARAWQHEIDHLNGVLLIDRLDAVTLTQLRQQLRELEEAARKPAGR